MSRLRINLDKSELIPMGRVENVGELAQEFDCKISALPSSYSGLPLSARFKDVTVWDSIDERLRKRLLIWKRQYISKEGRLTLIRSTLSSMSIYFMSLFCIPRGVKLRLEQIQRDFLSGGGALERKPHLVSWSIVYSDRHKGGLGVRNLTLLNKALLCKWSGRFAMEREAFWRQVICGKYGEEEGEWHSCEARERFGVGLSKAIKREGGAMGDNMAFSMGNGRRVGFWKHSWCGDDPLCTTLPSLFNVSLSKEVWVEDGCNHSREGGWDPRFSKQLND